MSGKANDAATALGRITAESVLRIEIVDGATLNIPGLSGQVANVVASVDAFSGNWNWNPEFRENLHPFWYRGSVSANGKTEEGWSWSAELAPFQFHNGNDGPGAISDGVGNLIDTRRESFSGSGDGASLAATLTYEAPEGAVANLNLSLGSFNFVGQENSFRSPVSAPPSARFSNVGEDGMDGQFGADYEFDLGPGRLKLNNSRSSGNAALVPEQAWILSSEINRKLGPWGAVKLAGEYQWIEDVVDRVPINASGQPVQNPIQNLSQIAGQGVGNIDKAWAASITASGTLNLDPIGAKGLQLEFSYRYRDSELDDPLTGIARQISSSSKVNTVASLRWDIPETPWTLVAGIEEGQSYANYRLDQVSRGWTAPSTNFFSVEHKDVFGMKVRLQAVNLNATSENFKREVYQPAGPGQPRLRTNPIDFVEERYRTFGPIVRLNVSGAF